LQAPWRQRQVNGYRAAIKIQNSAEIRLNLALISTTQSCADFIAKLGRDWPNWVRKATGEAA